MSVEKNWIEQTSHKWFALLNFVAVLVMSICYFATSNYIYRTVFMFLLLFNAILGVVMIYFYYKLETNKSGVKGK